IAVVVGGATVGGPVLGLGVALLGAVAVARRGLRRPRVGLAHVPVVGPRAQDRDRGVDVRLFVAGRAFGRLAGLVFVARGLALARRGAAAALAVRARATAGAAPLPVARAALGGPVLGLGVALLGAVAVARLRARRARVGLIHVPVVGPRAQDRHRSVDVGLLRARFARSGLFGGILVAGALGLLDQATEQAGTTAVVVGARERCARGEHERADARGHGNAMAFHVLAPFELR